MGESLTGLKRTHGCGEITTANIGESVTVMGWVQKQRNLGGMVFADLRDRSGIVQVVFRQEEGEDVFKKATTLRSEFVVAVKGVVSSRAPGMINTRMKTGEIEINANELRILSKAETPPIYIEENLDVNEATRLKYRYLDLRRPDMQKNFIMRHRIAKTVRDYFDENGFLEIETPMLIRSTPEGARDYLVPSRVHPGKFYALPQSPQIYKQLLMVSGFEKYFQIVRCFRDEDLRADRQPEFTQIDIEMSFIDQDDIIRINEGLLCRIFKDVMGYEIKAPFQRITYKEAMERYGSDKPDLRFGLELVDVSDIAGKCGFKVFSSAVESGGSVRAINVKSGGHEFSRKEIDKLESVVKEYKAKGMAWIVVEENGLKSPIAKFLSQDEINSLLTRVKAEPGDLVCIVADKDKVVFDALGHLRLEVAKKLDLIDNNEYKFVWVTEFPLLEYSEEEQRYVAMHHPFTSPMDEDLDLLDTDPGKVRAKAYDIVLNGIELGGGSIRIYNRDLQSKMFKILGFTEEQARERFGFLLEAFKYGTPPHGGIAYGFDRMVWLLSGADSMRDVIAFPKVQNASDLMSEAPNVVDQQQLEELHIKIDF